MTQTSVDQRERASFGRLVLQALLTALLLLAPAVARANCSLSAATLSFGTYTGAALNTGAGTVSLTCSSGTTWNIGINSGNNPGSGNYAWQLTDSNSDVFHYSMYRDAGRSALWGGSIGTDTISGTGTGSAQTVNFYASIPANSAVIPGSYTDSITMILYASSGNNTHTIAVSATVPASCTLSAGTLAFGTYTGLQTDATATLSVTCTNTTTYSVGLQQGNHATCCWTNYMSGPGGALLNYNVYRDAARSVFWGNTVGTDEVTGTGNGSNQSLTAYGRIPAGQLKTPGSYTDTVTATINY